MEQNYVVFDLETTGLDPLTSEITEIGAFKVKNGVVVGKFNELIRIKGVVPNTVAEITGITNNMLKDCEPIETVLPAFFEFTEGLPLVGYNITKFDMLFLIKQAQNCGIDFNDYRGVDVIDMARALLPNQSHKLCEVVKTLNIDVGEQGFHRASFDAICTKRVYEELTNKFGVNWNATELPVVMPTFTTEQKGVENGTLPLF